MKFSLLELLYFLALFLPAGPQRHPATKIQCSPVVEVPCVSDLSEHLVEHGDMNTWPLVNDLDFIQVNLITQNVASQK